jgi:transposase
MNIGVIENHGNKYLRLQESYSENKNGKILRKNRVIKNLGPLSRFDDGQPNYISRLRTSFKNKTPLIEELYEYVDKDYLDFVSVMFDRKKINESTLNPKVFADFLLDPIFNQLGISDVLFKYKSQTKIQYDLASITKLLTFGRILDPDSKLQTFEQNNNYLFPIVKDLELSHIYKALDVLDILSTKIQARMNNKISKGNVGRDTSHVFYDVTNYYYETQYNDEDEVLEVDGIKIIIKEGFRKRGISKENRHQPLTQMGLFIDDNGIPVSYKVFPGNHIDQTTLRPALKESIDNYSLGRVIVVADRGLNSDKNIAHLIKRGNGFVIAKSIKKNNKEVRKWILDQKDYRDQKGKFVKIDSELNFKIKSRVVERAIKDEYGKEITFREKQVVYWSKAHFLREARQNKAFMEYLDSAIKFPDKIKDKQAKIEYFMKTTIVDKQTGEVLKVKKVREVNEAKVQEFIDLMGYYLITTSEIEKTNGEIINIYHGLSRIEDSFRITKSDLEGRPVYVRKEEHINAHFLICFIALSIVRLLQVKVLNAKGEQAKVKTKKDKGDKWWSSGITAENLKKGLNKLLVTQLPAGMCLVSNTPYELKVLFDSLDAKEVRVLPTLSQIKQYRYALGREKYV